MTSSDGWRQPARPQAPAGPAQAPADFVPAPARAVACTRCGAVVAETMTDVHLRWHAGQVQRPPQRVVHGVSSPRDARTPHRVLELRSAQPPARAIELLRDWARGEGADLSIASTRGFSATFNARGWRWDAAGSASVRCGFDLEPDDRGAKLTVLMAPAYLSGMAALETMTATSHFEQRFDQLEAGITDLLGLR